MQHTSNQKLLSNVNGGGSRFISRFIAEDSPFDSIKQLRTKGATSLSYHVCIDGKEYFMKQLRPELNSDWRHRLAFHKEYEVGSKIDSKYIVRYVKINENENGIFILMDYINGMTLEDKISKEPSFFFKKKNLEKLFLQLLDGISALHKENVAYIDLKPDNIIITQISNDVRIIDLGFCFADGSSQTIGYNEMFAAPELKKGGLKDIDERTDIYAIGQLMNYIKNSTCCRTSKRMQRIIEKCTSNDKTKRYCTCDEVIKEFKSSPASLYLKSAAAIAIITAVCIWFGYYHKTEHYRMLSYEIKWLMQQPDYDFKYENNYYKIISEDSLTCKAVGGTRMENLYIHDAVVSDEKKYVVTEIASHAYGGWNAKSAYLPANIRKIGEYAFNSCRLVGAINLSDSVKEIGHSCFEYMTNLRYLKLSPNIKEIPSKAFAQCVNLKTLNIPEGCESIGFDAFACCDMLKEVSLPSTLKRIDRGVFWRCTSLKEINIPSSVESLGEYVFFDCDSLQNVYCHIPTPISIPPIFNSKNVTLHVPKGSEQLYRKADNWNAARIVGF